MDNKKKKILFGTTAGLCEAVIMQPLDTIKVLKQSNQYKGLIPTIKNNGFLSLYRGLTPFMYQMTTKYFLRYSTFELFRGKSNNKYRNFTAGIAAGFSESLFITPFELIKTNMQTNKIKDKTMRNTALDLFKNGGIRSMYRGFLTTGFRQAINQGSNFMVYHEIRKKILQDDPSPPLYKFLLSGFISGSVGPLLNNPFDVIKTRYMNPNFDGKYKNILDAGKQIVKYEGFSTLYSGMGLRLVRVAGGQGVVFFIIESLNKYFNYI